VFPSLKRRPQSSSSFGKFGSERIASCLLNASTTTTPPPQSGDSWRIYPVTFSEEQQPVRILTTTDGPDEDLVNLRADATPFDKMESIDGGPTWETYVPTLTTFPLFLADGWTTRGRSSIAVTTSRGADPPEWDARPDLLFTCPPRSWAVATATPRHGQRYASAKVTSTS